VGMSWGSFMRTRTTLEFVAKSGARNAQNVARSAVVEDLGSLVFPIIDPEDSRELGSF
jgi:hypothetical protein